MSSIIVDIDGTIADCSHRLKYLEENPKNWDGFFSYMHKDKPIQPIIRLIEKLQNHNFSLIFCTGRPERYRALTKEWLCDQDLDPRYLYMRNDTDFRPNHIIKSELLNLIYDDGFLPLLVIDDQQSVVEMWRTRGLICLQNESPHY